VIRKIWLAGKCTINETKSKLDWSGARTSRAKRIRRVRQDFIDKRRSADKGLGEVTEAVVEEYITRQTRQVETRQTIQKRQKRQRRQGEKDKQDNMKQDK
jgi:hypothetical protein